MSPFRSWGYPGGNDGQREEDEANVPLRLLLYRRFLSARFLWERGQSDVIIGPVKLRMIYFRNFAFPPSFSLRLPVIMYS